MPISPTRNKYTFRLYNIRHRQAFFNLLGQALLPDYFGGSWDALDGCMRDLSWLPEHGPDTDLPRAGARSAAAANADCRQFGIVAGILAGANRENGADSVLSAAILNCKQPAL